LSDPHPNVDNSMADRPGRGRASLIQGPRAISQRKITTTTFSCICMSRRQFFADHDKYRGFVKQGQYDERLAH